MQRFDQLEILVLDEADRMLDMASFATSVDLVSLPKKRQVNLLVLSKFLDDIRGLAKGLVNNPVETSVFCKLNGTNCWTEHLSSR